MVEIGGEIVTKGNSEQRLPWKIGVTKPTDDSLNTNQEIQTVLNVTDKAMATSVITVISIIKEVRNMLIPSTLKQVIRYNILFSLPRS